MNASEKLKADNAWKKRVATPKTKRIRRYKPKIERSYTLHVTMEELEYVQAMLEERALVFELDKESTARIILRKLKATIKWGKANA